MRLCYFERRANDQLSEPYWGRRDMAELISGNVGLPRDPDRTVLHRALRVALVLPLAFAFGLHGLANPQLALFAAFGSFSTLAMADFVGPHRSRLVAYTVLMLVGCAMIVIGTVLSNTVWQAVAVMAVIGAALQFSAALGGQFALGNNTAILMFVLSVMVPAGSDAIPDRLGGWILACACAAIATALLWPRHERRDLYLRLVEAVRALASIARNDATGDSPGAGIDDAKAAVDRAIAAHGMLGFRPIGPISHQRALLGLIDDLGQNWRFAAAMPAGRRMSEDDRALALAIATTLDAVAGVLAGCVDGRRSTGPDLQALVAARRRHLQILDATTQAAVAAGASATTVVAAIEAVFPTRVMSFVTLAMAANAIVLTDRTARIVGDDFGMGEPIAPEDALRRARSVLAPHLAPGAVWFRNSVRAGAALALSVLIAKISGIEHAFWVVLATLTVLRSNVATTGTTVVSAVIGTLAGFLLASAATLAIGTHAPLMWAALPLAVFLAAYAPAAISLGAGQAMFALLVVLLFNLMVPDGWHTGAVRLEAVTVGALAALAASLIMWPKGAAAVLRAEAALHVRAASELTRSSFAFLLGTGDAARVESAKEECLRARQRAEEALAAYSGERGQKRVPLAMLVSLVRIPISIGVADDALMALRHAGYGVEGCPAAARRVAETARSVYESLDELAARLDDPRRAPNRELRVLIEDLDMVSGSGNRRAEIAAATAACLDAHRADADALPWLIGLSWATLWLGYLAHLRVLTDTPLNEVLANAETPWWR
jgi:uncharacterized membrane protein YccC